MEKTFRIKHVALYTKGWYERSENVWNDLNKCLQKDDYLLTQHRDEILAIIIRNISPLFKETLADFAHQLVFETLPENCWKYGYYHKGCKWLSDRKDFDELKEYNNETAVLWFMLSKLQGTTIMEIGDLPAPDDTVLPVTEKAKEKFAKMFSK